MAEEKKGEEFDPVLFPTQIEQDLIKLFKKTYSAYHIRHFSRQQKDALKIKFVDNDVLVTLIDNLEIQPKSYQVDFLEGPVHFCLYQFENKTVYLLGEYHRNTNGHCALYGVREPPQKYQGLFPRTYRGTTLRVPHFIELLSRETPSFFDFYLETGVEDLYSYYDGFYLNIPMSFIIVFFYIWSGGQISDILLPLDFTDGNAGDYALNSLYNIAINYYNNLGSPPVPFFIQPDQTLIKDIEDLVNSFKFECLNSKGISEIEETKTYFQDCFNPSTRKNFDYKCKLGRFHNVDGRKIAQPNLEPIKIISLLDWLTPHYSSVLNNYFEACLQLLKNIGIENFFLKLLNPSTGTPQHNLFEHIIDNYPDVKNQWEVSLCKNQIRDFIENEIENINIYSLQRNISKRLNLPLRRFKIDTFINECLAMFQDPLATSNQGLYMMTYGYMYEIFFNYYCYIMDIYCLSRVFKKFDVKENQPEESYNIIIYAGDLHVRVYSDFIKFLGHKPVFETINPQSLSCVPVGFSSINPIQNLNIN